METARDSANAVRGTAAISGHVRVVDAEKHDYGTSRALAAERGGRFASRKELVMEANSPEGFERLKGNSYWMDHLLWMRTGYYMVNPENGEFTRVSESSWRGLPKEQRAVVYGGKGPGPAAMRINGDRDTNGDEEHCKYEIIQNPTILAGTAIVDLPKLRKDGR